MRRYGYAIRVGGDSEIAGALAAGIESGTASADTTSLTAAAGTASLAAAAGTSSAPCGGTFPRGEGLGDGFGGQASDAVRRVAMMQHTPEEWAEMTEEARVFYGGQRYMPWLAEKLLIGYALICYVISIGWRALMESLNM